MGCDINTMIEVRLGNDDDDYERWVCAGSVDHFIGRFKAIFAVLGNACNYDGIPFISHGRLSKETIMTEEKIAEAKEIFDDDRLDGHTFDDFLKDVYRSELETHCHLSLAFIDRLIEWDTDCHDASFVTLKEMMDYDTEKTFFSTCFRMPTVNGVYSIARNTIDYGSEENRVGTVKIFEEFPGGTKIWLNLIDFIRKTGELYGQTNPERIRLCFFFDS